MKITFVVTLFILSGSFVIAQSNTFPTSGNVGIGTTSPIGRLEINGAGGQLRLTGGSIAGGVWTNATDRLYLADWNTGTKGIVVNMTSGNVGIGITGPAFSLDVNGTIRSFGYLRTTGVTEGNGVFADDGSGSTIFSITRQSNNETRFQSYGYHTFYSGNSTGSEKMRITGTGNVGIGISDPDPYRLWVNGTNEGYGIGTSVLKSLSDFSDGSIYGVVSHVAKGSSTSGSNSIIGIYGYAETTYGQAIGVYGKAEKANASGYRAAGYFNGNLQVIGSFWNSSDLKLKENIKVITNPLAIITKINPVEYTFIESQNFVLPEGKQSGFLAQNIQQVLPHLVQKSFLPNDKVDSTLGSSEEYLSVNYLGLIPYTIGAIHELQETIIRQQKTIDLMSAKMLEDSNKAQQVFDLPHFVLIYPNPASDYVNVRVFNSYDSRTTALYIYDKEGNLLLTSALKDDYETISTLSLNEGIYLLSLVIDNVTYDVKRLVIKK